MRISRLTYPMEHTILIAGDDGLLLNARVDIEANDLILHSRSGVKPGGRNPDYRPALMRYWSA